MSDYIDFNRVPPEQRDIHDRLEGWAIWLMSDSSRPVCPMFRQVKSHARQWEMPQPKRAVDTKDALAIEKIVSQLPNKYREALRWFYVFRKPSPLQVARRLAVSKAGLLEVINDGRTMVKNQLR